MIKEKYSIDVQKNDEESAAIITGVLPKDELDVAYDTALEEQRATIEIKGFRKGQAPKEQIEKAVGENTIYTKAAEQMVRLLYPTIIAESKLDVVGIPQLNFTKLAKGNDVHFEVKVSFIEEFKLPDYVAIAKAELRADVEEVKQEDIDAIQAQIKNGIREGKDLDKPLTDEEVKKIAQVETVDEFLKLLKENLKREKEVQAKQKHRVRLAKSLIDKVNINVPKLLVDTRVNMLVDRLKFDARRMGGTFEDFLKKENKTEEQIREDMIPKAKESVIFELLLDKISEKENIKVEDNEIVEQVEQVMKANPKAQKEYVQAYIKEELKREKVIQMLESYTK